MKYFLVIFLLFVLSSCSIQKRLYNKGFYVSNSRTNKKVNIKDTAKAVSLLHTIQQVKEETNTAPLLAIASEAIEVIHKKQINYSAPIIKREQTLLQDPCDTIVMKTGERVLGKVTKVKKYFVVFENCSGLGYSSSYIYIRCVSQIIYGSPLHETQLDNKKKKQRLITKLIAVFLLLLSIVLYAIGFNQIGALMPLLGVLASFILIVSLIMLLAVALSKNRDKD